MLNSIEFGGMVLYLRMYMYGVEILADFNLVASGKVHRQIAKFSGYILLITPPVNVIAGERSIPQKFILAVHFPPSYSCYNSTAIKQLLLGNTTATCAVVLCV